MVHLSAASVKLTYTQPLHNNAKLYSLPEEAGVRTELVWREKRRASPLSWDENLQNYVHVFFKLSLG